MKALFKNGNYYGSGSMSDAEALTYKRQGFEIREITEKEERELLVGGMIKQIFDEPKKLDELLGDGEFFESIE